MSLIRDTTIYHSIENLIGNGGNDKITGNNNDNILIGGGGYNDLLYGLREITHLTSGKVLLRGGNGDDNFYFASNQGVYVTFYGEAGEDVFDLTGINRETSGAHVTGGDDFDQVLLFGTAADWTIEFRDYNNDAARYDIHDSTGRIVGSLTGVEQVKFTDGSVLDF